MFYALVGNMLFLYHEASHAKRDGDRGKVLYLIREAITIGKLAVLFAPNEYLKESVENNIARAQDMCVQVINSPGPYALTSTRARL
jgi:hypothetical protein